MWRHLRRRPCLLAVMLLPPYLSSPAERMAPECSGLSSAAGAVPIADCAGLEALSAPVVEDLTLSFEGTGAIVCDKVWCLVVGRVLFSSRCVLLAPSVPAFNIVQQSTLDGYRAGYQAVNMRAVSVGCTSASSVHDITT